MSLIFSNLVVIKTLSSNHCLNTEILHTVLTIKRLKWEQEMYLIASLALILNFEF